MKLWTVVFLLAGYGLLLLLTAVQLRFWLDRLRPGVIGKGGRALLRPALAAAALLPVLGALLPESGLMLRIQAAGNIFLGLLIFFAAALTLLSLLSLLIRRARPAGTFSHRFAAGVLLAALAVTLAANAVGLYTAVHPRAVCYSVSIDKNADGCDRLRAVLIADLHIGVNSSPALYERMVRLVNQQDPDVIFVAGDIVTSSYRGMKDPDTYREILLGLRAKYGVYAIFGNHDVDEPLFGGFTLGTQEQALRNPELTAFLDGCGWTCLDDETAVIADGAVQLAGRRDGERTGDGTGERAEIEALLAPLDRSRPILVLEHEPVELRELAEAGADLCLCGHTHNGQIFPGNLVAGLFADQVCGLEQWDGMACLVTSGVGFFGPPLRLGTISEVSVLDIDFGKELS